MPDRRVEPTAPPTPAALEALEQLEPPPYVPPRPLALALVLATMMGAAWFVVQGVRDAAGGEHRLASRLLKVEARDRDPIPFTLKDMSGRDVSLASFKDKVVFLNFWATWCPPCVEEMPSMIRLHDKLKDRPGFAMLAVSADDEWEPVQKFFSAKAPSFPVLLDAKGNIAKQYGTTMFPETYVVVDGRVRGFIEGPRDWDTWYARAYLEGLLEKNGGPALASN